MVSGSNFSDLAPEIQRNMYRRMAGMGLLYAGSWAANFLFFSFVVEHASGEMNREHYWYTMSAVWTTFGLLVYLLCRNQRIPSAHFLNFAVLFEVVGAIGIMSGYYRWEHQGELFMTRVAVALGLDSARLVTELIEPLDAAGLRLSYAEGVSWVGIWALAFPLVIPSPLGRTILATLLTVLVVPAFMFVSLLINGIPESMETWVMPYLVETSVPTLICGAIAVYGSRVVYRLTRDLSNEQRMGSYQLVERIGSGGMGEVWRAKHRLLVRPAAIKLIREEALGKNPAEAEDALRRFEREAQATSGLTSPHSIDLYDFGVTAEGSFYYVMELLEGIDLKSLVTQFGPLPAERAIYVLRQVCHSLYDAHSTGVIHRDVKPGNIFVCRYGAEHDFVKVLDFGLVKQIGDQDGKASQITMMGMACGTPGFMAPEMAVGSTSVDRRADLYGLGCVAYWLLTGALVFEGATPIELLVRHAKDEPPPPSARTEMPIPQDLEQVVLQCLEKEPRKRPQDARELDRMLASCESSLPEWNEEKRAEWWRTYVPDLSRGTTSSGLTPVDADVTHAL